MAEARFLLIRLGSMGDIVHALPAASALRDTFPDARIDWVVDPKWARVLEGNPDISEVILFNRKSPVAFARGIQKLRAAKYTCAIDFQGLYKSALLAYASGAPRRIGFTSTYAREGLASLGYTERLNPRGAHKVNHNLTLAGAAGALKSKPRFPLAVKPEDDAQVSHELAAHGTKEFFVLNPGGGWRSKCWPAERYGALHQKLAERYGCSGVVTYGPGEENLVQELITAAGNAPPAAIPLGLGPLMALTRRAKFVVSADTGPLHIAAALGARCIGLFGPTDPSRNGPYPLARNPAAGNIVVRNPKDCVTTYKRGEAFSTSMLSITVEQVCEAVERRLELPS